jgi:hypothetical protein
MMRQMQGSKQWLYGHLLGNRRLQLIDNKVDIAGSLPAVSIFTSPSFHQKCGQFVYCGFGNRIGSTGSAVNIHRAL